jgi:aminomethyltransferase
MESKTPLYDRHVSAGGRMVPFAGYLLPVQYTAGVIAEHMAVRTACGLFDVSHMGEIIFTGTDALKTIQRLFTNDFAGMQDGRVRYSPMCNEAGGILDDLITYKFDSSTYYVVVNASNRHKDAAWMKDHLAGDTVMADVSDTVAQLALQGPKAQDILSRVADAGGLPLKYYSFTREMAVAGMPCLVSRTGYTGEDGFELYCANEHAPALWDALLKAGAEDGLIPCGLGARDTLRLEAAMPLYGHEMDESITPPETGLGMYVKPSKTVPFIGMEAILAKGEPAVSRVGLEVTGRGIVREACTVYAAGKQVGRTTSGTHCPYLDRPVAMALVDIAYAVPGIVLFADVRGRMVETRVVPLPFYRRPGKT